MRQIEITNGTRRVISTSNGEGSPWSSRLYVNSGETATLICAKHKSEAGARKWAARTLEG
jgi:hypothetical protein